MDQEERLRELTSRLLIKEHEVWQAVTSDFPLQRRDRNLNPKNLSYLEFFKNKFRIKTIAKNKNDMEFDLIGISAPIVNAFRRILIAEVASMAIEKVVMRNNTSIIQDEVLAHRLGLIPLKADARLFSYRPCDSGLDGSEHDTLEFELKVRCSHKPTAFKDATHPDDLYDNHKVYSRDIKWIPKGKQASQFSAEDVQPVDGDILIAKMRPGHEIDVKLLAVKSIGKDHAKFSPVATAYYRLMPEITLLREVEGEDADTLQKCFSEGVIEVENKNGKRVAKVVNARYDECSRNIFMHDHLKDAVKLQKVKEHFIFMIESVGALPPDILMEESIKILMEKCQTLSQAIENIQTRM